MKNTGVCPKCTSTDIRLMRRRMWPTMIPLGRTIFGAAYSTLYICTVCGFVEAWVESREELNRIARKLAPREG